MNEVTTMGDLINEWEDLNYDKNGYAFGDEILDRTAFANLIHRTIVEIEDFKGKVFGVNSAELLEPIDKEKDITPYDIIMYSNLIAVIAKYSTSILTDESDDYIFTASLIVTRFLLSYAGDTLQVSSINDNGILCGKPYLADIEQSDEDEDFEFWSRDFHFDTNTGDFTEVIELAKRYNQYF